MKKLIAACLCATGLAASATSNAAGYLLARFATIHFQSLNIQLDLSVLLEDDAGWRCYDRSNLSKIPVAAGENCTGPNGYPGEDDLIYGLDTHFTINWGDGNEETAALAVLYADPVRGIIDTVLWRLGEPGFAPEYQYTNPGEYALDFGPLPRADDTSGNGATTVRLQSRVPVTEQMFDHSVSGVLPGFRVTCYRDTNCPTLIPAFEFFETRSVEVRLATPAESSVEGTFIQPPGTLIDEANILTLDPSQLADGEHSILLVAEAGDSAMMMEYRIDLLSDPVPGSPPAVELSQPGGAPLECGDRVEVQPSDVGRIQASGTDPDGDVSYVWINWPWSRVNPMWPSPTIHVQLVNTPGIALPGERLVTFEATDETGLRSQCTIIVDLVSDELFAHGFE